MKTSKLLVLGTLLVALCMAVPAMAALSLDDSIEPFLESYQIGDTIEFILCVGVKTGDVPLVNVDVYFFPPGTSPSDGTICQGVASDPSAVFVGHIDLLQPGTTVCFDSTDNSALAYPVTAAGCDEPTSVLAYMATTFRGQGSSVDLCDEKTTENLVEPVDAPTCSIFGPREICRGATQVEYCSEFTADTYLWEITGDGEIVGANNLQCVDVNPTGSDTYTLTLTVCNNNGDAGCCNECDALVDVVPAPDCLIDGPDSICEDATEVEFCSNATADSYFWEITSGDASIVGSDTLNCVRVSPGSSAQFDLRLSVCFADPQCCDDCFKTVDVISIPECPIEGAETVCEEETGIVYCGPEGADSYSWSIEGNGAIVGLTDDECVTVDAGLAIDGGFTLTLVVCNESDLGDCCDECTLEVTVEECGQTYCSFTQGFWGNAGGTKCDPAVSTTDLLVVLLDAVNASTPGLDPVVVGSGGATLTLDTAQCILDLLPAGGTPAALPTGTWACSDLDSLQKPKNGKGKGKGNDKPSRLNNVLIGQVVALTLNLRMSEGCIADSGDLASWTLPDEFCTVPYDNPEACPKHYESPITGIPVGDLLTLANTALGGGDISPYTLSDIYEAVTAINEGFDECATVVACPVEICDNLIDDDCDGEVDEIDCVILDGPA